LRLGHLGSPLAELASDNRCHSPSNAHTYRLLLVKELVALFSAQKRDYDRFLKPRQALGFFISLLLSAVFGELLQGAQLCIG